MIKICEWCKKQFEAKTKRARLCSPQCVDKRRYSMHAAQIKEGVKRRRLAHPERAKGASARYRTEHADKVRAASAKYIAENAGRLKCYRQERYDTGGCLVNNEKNKKFGKILAADPARAAQYRVLRRENKRRCLARKKLLAARAAYLADPINAARVAAANLTRMSPEERDAWIDAAEKQREKEERKEVREATKKLHAAKQTTPAKVEEAFPAVFDLEWSE